MKGSGGSDHLPDDESIRTLTQEDEILLNRYLLNDLPADMRAQVEDRYVSDPVLFEAMTALEGELLRDYASRALGPKERRQLEERLEKDQSLREQLQLIQSLGEVEPGNRPAGALFRVRQWFRDLSRMRMVAVAAATLVLIAIGTITFERVAKLQSKIDALARQMIQPGAPVVQFNPTFALLAGVTRAPGAPPPLSIAPNAQMARFQMAIVTTGISTLRIALRSPDNGSEIWSGFVAGGPQVEVEIPAGLLKPGDYILSASNPAGNEIQSWSFRIVRP
jgi:hypothetical protein